MRIVAIMPARNAESTVEAAIESILRQSRLPEEIIVVDDGSTDRTPEILARIARHTTRMAVFHQEQTGPAAARSLAISQSSAELIAPLDADDVWHDAYLETMGMALEQDRAAGFAYSQHDLIDQDGIVVRGSMPFTIQGGCFGPMLLSNMVGNGSSAVFMRRAVIEAGGYQPPSDGWYGGEDYLLQLRIAARREIICVPHVLTSYRTGQNSLQSDYRKSSRARLQAVDCALQEFGPCPLPVRRWAAADSLRVRAVFALQAGFFAEPVRCLAKALMIDPKGTASDVFRRAASLAKRMTTSVKANSAIDPLVLDRMHHLQAAMPYGRGHRKPVSESLMTDTSATA